MNQIKANSIFTWAILIAIFFITSCSKPVKVIEFSWGNCDYVKVKTTDEYTIYKGDTIYQLDGEYHFRGTHTDVAGGKTYFHQSYFVKEGVLIKETDSTVYINDEGDSFYDAKYAQFEPVAYFETYKSLDEDTQQLVGKVLPYGCDEESDTLVIDKSRRVKFVLKYGMPNGNSNYHRGTMKGGSFNEDKFQFKDGIPIGAWEVFGPMHKDVVMFNEESGKIESKEWYQRKSKELPLILSSREQYKSNGSSIEEIFNECEQVIKYREWQAGRVIGREIRYYINGTTALVEEIHYDKEGKEINSVNSEKEIAPCIGYHPVTEPQIN
jgi:hypothetical protein